MAYQINLPNYVGPFEGLYEELNKNRANLQTFALAVVVEGFLSYLREQRDSGLNLDEASTFLVLIATLLDIKARLLFPPAEVEKDEPEDMVGEDPEVQMAEYRRFQQVAEWLAAVGNDRQQFITREPAEPTELGLEGPDPLAQVTMRDLMRAFDRIFILADELQEPLAPVYRDQWTVDEQLRWLEERLANKGAVAFEAVFAPGSGRMMLIVTFLALLELIKLGAVTARQERSEGTIMLIWLGASRAS